MRIHLEALLMVFSLSGCASWTAINKQVDFKDAGPSIVFVDAKQRAVISNETGANGGARLRRFCAEPSPDALSAFAATAGLNLSAPSKGDLGYSQAFSEGAASIGLRTQSIQLLRDVMFSNCEAFVNQGITGFGLETMQRRFQSTLVAVLAIEQLTGVSKAQAVALGGKATANSAEVLGAAIKLVADSEAAATVAQTQLDSADAASKTAKGDLDTYAKAHSGDTTSSEYLAAKDKSDKAAAASKAATTAKAARDDDVVASKAVRAAAASSGGGGSLSAVFAPETSPGKLDANSTTAIANAVTDIVKSTLELGFSREFCTTLFGRIISEGSLQPQNSLINSPLATQCLKYVEADVALLQAGTERYQKETANLGKELDVTLKILDMVAKGTLSVDSGSKILAANAAASAAVTKEPVPKTPTPITFSLPITLKKIRAIK